MLKNNSITRPIGVDIAGFGMSDVTGFVPSVLDWQKVIVPVLDQLEIGKACILGHHTGAVVATAFAVENSDRVERLILHGALLVTDDERAARLARVIENEKNTELDPDGDHLCSAVRTRKRMYGADADTNLITRYVVERFMGYGPTWYGHYASYTYDHGDALKQVRCPTLIMSNTGDMVHDLTMRAKSWGRTLTMPFSKMGASTLWINSLRNGLRLSQILSARRHSD